MFYSYQDSSYLTCILVFTQSPPLAKKRGKKSSPAIQEKSVGGGSKGGEGSNVHTLLLYFFLPFFPFFPASARTQECLEQSGAARFFSPPPPPLFSLRVPSLIRSTIGGVNTCQLTDFLFPVAYEKIMAAGLQRLLPHQYEFTTVFTPHSAEALFWYGKSCAF